MSTILEDEAKQEVHRSVWYRDEWVWLFLILAVGLALRLWYLSEVVQAPDFRALRQDVDVQDYQARAMLSGDWTVRPEENDPEIPTTPYYRPPGYPYLLSVIYAITDGSYLAPRLFNLFLGLMTCILIYFLGRSVFGGVTGLIAAFLHATYWGFLFYEGEVNDPAVFVFLVPCLLLVLYGWTRRMGPGWAGLAGIIIGCYALMRPNILLFGPVLAAWMLWIAWRRGGSRRILLSWCVLALATFSVIAPVTVRNYRVSGEIVPISTYFGENFLIGNGEDSDGVTPWTPYLQKLEGTGNWSVWVYINAVRGLGKELGIEPMPHAEASKRFFDMGLAYMREHKLRTLKLWIKKAVLFWSPWEITENKVVQCEKDYYPPLKYLPGFPLVMAVWLCGLLFLICEFRPRRAVPGNTAAGVPSLEMMVLFVLFIAVYFGSFLPFFVNARARVPIIGLCFLMGSHGLYKIGCFAARRRYGYFAGGLALVAVLYGLASLDPYSYAPDRARWHYDRADSFLREGKVKEALAEAEEMMALPERPMFYMPHRLGYAFVRLGRYAEAVPLIRASLSPKPDEQDPRYRQDAYYHLGIALSRSGKVEEGIAAYNEALKMKGDDARVLNDLGVLAEQQGKTEEALARYGAALRAVPNFGLAHSNLGDLLGRLGRHEEAAAHFQQAVEAEPKNGVYRFNLGIHLAAMGKVDEAMQAYRAAISLCPADPRPYNNLGLLLAARGQGEAAIAEYKEAWRVAPGFGLALVNWAHLLEERDGFEAAVALYEKELEEHPKDPVLYNDLGSLYARHQDYARAMECYQRAIQNAPAFAASYDNVGMLLMEQGKTEEAVAQFTQALATDPKEPQADFHLGEALFKLGKNTEALEHYRRALNIYPQREVVEKRLSEMAAGTTVSP